MDLDPNDFPRISFSKAIASYPSPAPNFNKKELGVEFHVTLDFASPSQSPFVPNPAAPSCLDHLIAELNYRPLTH